MARPVTKCTGRAGGRKKVERRLRRDKRSKQHDYHGTTLQERESTPGPANRLPAIGGGGADSGVVDLDDGPMQLVAGPSPVSRLNRPISTYDPAGRYSPAPPGFVEWRGGFTARRGLAAGCDLP